jgi:hypothetical protein
MIYSDITKKARLFSTLGYFYAWNLISSVPITANLNEYEILVLRR